MIIEKYLSASEEYEKAFPESSIPSTLEFSYGPDGAVKILEAANGREIIIKYIDGTTGQMRWKYKGDIEWHEGF